MNDEDFYKLHLQLLSIYEKNKQCSGAYQKKTDYYKKQLSMFAENNVQRVFVLNQLLKIHEKNREALVSSCADRYFLRDISVNAESGI
ncbi:hypothetical protein GMA19_04216 [Paenibacillus polymyxa E681]|uniref:hypothetical protein n=1 Tax=Paenibacillus polymyxa TaxID=1406 RepID=UPI000CD36772|nr:hypothetical protein [Paenibacillus polymyxa]ADM71988.2 hypothetical protein PPE_04208 [Paenibacillus polymyxa E681]QNV59020.1 hypothetical protein GE561_04227 [Paenibacillus polymyxa E681]QNV63846.1 hypothetical protein GMA19_04216 [Paenibacillus polymyxa E681]